MEPKRIFITLIGFLCLASSYGQSKSNTTDFEEHYFGNVMQVIDADEFFFYKGGYIILRKEDRYSVVSQYGTTVIPEGKYMFNMKPDEDKYNRFNPFALVVRDPASGLYGLFDLHNEIERVPCKYNELTPFYWNLDVAIGTYHDLKNNQKKKYFINTAGDEFPFHDFTFGSSETSYSRYVKVLGGSDAARALNLERNKQYIYDIWEGKVTAVFDSPIDFRYHGNNLFIVYQSFNGLEKYSFINHLGETVIPFRDRAGLAHISPFQRANPEKFGVKPKSVALLHGNRGHYFAYALLDETGEIYSMLKEGEGFSSIHAVDRGEVVRGKILINAQKQGASISDLYLWDLFEDKKLTDVTEMLDRSIRDIPFALQERTKPSFRFRGRNGKSILFDSNIVFAYHKSLFDVFPMARDLSTSGGISSRNAPGTIGKFGYDVSGYGIIDEETGTVKVMPVFRTMTLPDRHSGLAYAEMVYNDRLYKGFIETDGAMAGAFRILLQ